MAAPDAEPNRGSTPRRPGSPHTEPRQDRVKGLPPGASCDCSRGPSLPPGGRPEHVLVDPWMALAQSGLLGDHIVDHVGVAGDWLFQADDGPVWWWAGRRGWLRSESWKPPWFACLSSVGNQPVGSTVRGSWHLLRGNDEVFRGRGPILGRSQRSLRMCEACELFVTGCRSVGTIQVGPQSTADPPKRKEKECASAQSWQPAEAC